MITKPEEANPRREIVIVLPDKPQGIEALHGTTEPHFTAKQCADIARAYASALHASEFNSADAAIDAAKWESKFKEWERTK